MAQRWTGNLTVRIAYSDRDGRYRARVCTISQPRECKTVFVRPPAHLERAVDDPRAYDEAARAAISFADMQEHADYTPDLSDVVLRRGLPTGPARSWGKKQR